MIWPKPRDYKAHDMVYHDRCMLKWQGFILSDHSEIMTEEEQTEPLLREVIKFDEQELEERDYILSQVLNTGITIRITLDIPGSTIKYVSGHVQDIRFDKLVLITTDGILKIKTCDIYEIRIL